MAQKESNVGGIDCRCRFGSGSRAALRGEQQAGFSVGVVLAIGGRWDLLEAWIRFAGKDQHEVEKRSAMIGSGKIFFIFSIQSPMTLV